MGEVKRYEAVHLRYDDNNIRYGDGCEVEVVLATDYAALEAENARLRAGQEPTNRAHIMDALLMWNRRHEAPPIKVGYEYGVAEAVLDLIGTTPQPSAGAVMPARKPIEPLEFNRTTIDVLNEGWNACLDALARLNGKEVGRG